MLQAMRASGVVPMARVPWLEPGIIMKALDAGAFGIICPMENNAQQAAEFVSYMRYPPLGQRSFGPTRVSFAAGACYGAHANNEMLAFAMIETAEGMANLSSIAATPGLDGLYVGPADLMLGLAQGRFPPGVRSQRARDDRGAQGDCRCVQDQWDPRRAPLWNARLRGARHRGVRHDDGVGRLKASGRSRRGQRGKVAATDGRVGLKSEKGAY